MPLRRIKTIPDWYLKIKTESTIVPQRHDFLRRWFHFEHKRFCPEVVKRSFSELQQATNTCGKECAQTLQGIYSSDLTVWKSSTHTEVNSWMSEEFRCNVKPQSVTGTCLKAWGFKRSTDTWYYKKQMTVGKTRLDENTLSAALGSHFFHIKWHIKCMFLYKISKA